jgi:fatty acid desaturase
MQAVTKSLSREDADAFGRALDAIRQEVVTDLGARDVEHIRRMMRLAQHSGAAGRILLHVGVGPASFVFGVSTLALAKILENMEIGHNVLHGQYDWTKDPALDSRRYEWDIVCTADDWRHSHNYEHHTFTNIIGRDRDIGYAMLRVSPDQPWRLAHLAQPAAAILLALLFQWGIGAYDLRVDECFNGKQTFAQLRARARPFLAKARWQLAKDYVVFPALALWNAPRVALGNLLANTARNVWAFAVIFCGHFPQGVRFFAPSEIEHETRADWYLRQVQGSANIEGGRWFHVLTGHLSHQIEHHLFPDLPAARYPSIAPKVRALCERYGQPYTTGSFIAQLTSVARNLLRLSLPSLEPASMS